MTATATTVRCDVAVGVGGGIVIGWPGPAACGYAAPEYGGGTGPLPAADQGLGVAGGTVGSVADCCGVAGSGCVVGGSGLGC
ncbi:hypothetical protein [Micromonospora sp. bgisy143]|uniref:hypothetical protein n=1 Tax=Micromonospora sp. bgisy143 TaxID=3413790 RepID=UPI003EBB95D0